MTLKQKRAISYSIQEKKHLKEKEFLLSINKYEDFLKSNYKYMCNYIRYGLNN